MCLKQGLHRLQNPLPPFDTPQRCGPFFSLPDVAAESAATIPAHVHKSRPLYKNENR
jgi:hypothetical protein